MRACKYWVVVYFKTALPVCANGDKKQIIGGVYKIYAFLLKILHPEGARKIVPARRIAEKPKQAC